MDQRQRTAAAASTGTGTAAAPPATPAAPVVRVTGEIELEGARVQIAELKVTP